MKYSNIVRLIVIAFISLSVFSTGYAASAPIRSWPVDLCAVSRVSIRYLPKPTHCSRSIVVRAKEISHSLTITFQTRQPAVIQLTRAQFYNSSGQLVRDEPYFYPAVVPKPKDYKTRQSSQLMLASDDEIKVVYTISVRWRYQGGVENRTYVYNRQPPTQLLVPTSPTLNPLPFSHQTIPADRKPEALKDQATSGWNGQSESSVNHDQPAHTELVQVTPNIQETTSYIDSVVKPAMVEPISRDVRSAPDDHPDQSSSLSVANPPAKAITNGVQPISHDESELAQVSPVDYSLITPLLNPPSIDHLPDGRHDLRPKPKLPQQLLVTHRVKSGQETAPKEGRAPQIIEISPKRVGAQIFAHVKTDQGAAIILSSLSRCQGEACFGWQAMIVPPTDPSQLVTQIDLPILDLDTTAVPSDIRLTVTTIDLAKRTANFSYRYDPATNTLTPLNQAVF